MKRFIRRGFYKIGISRWHECGPEDTSLEFNDSVRAFHFLRTFMRDHRNMLIFRDVLADSSICSDLGRLTDEELCMRLAHQIVRGRVRLVVTAEPVAGAELGTVKEEEEKTPPPVEVKKEKTWIEFRLVDQFGEPVAGARYRMTLTDGKIREGRLDDNGSVRADEIDPGTCDICFLDYDAREWQRQ